MSMVRMAEIVEERYGWPGERCQRRRPSWHRVKALDWELTQFAAIVSFDPAFAASTMISQLPFYWALMIWRYKSGQYRAEGGHDLHEVDLFIKNEIDAQEKIPCTTRG
jgi:hypothetical protein